jgi:hypothetical protein
MVFQFLRTKPPARLLGVISKKERRHDVHLLLLVESKTDSENWHPVPFITVSTKDVEKFDVAIAIACMVQSNDRLEYQLPDSIQVRDYNVPDYFYSTDGCLVLSFDGAWYPFLDNTRGYNRSFQRWYIPKTSELLARIGHALQTPDQKRISGDRPGGRVFIHAGGVVRRPTMSREIEVANWQLPKASAYIKQRH